MLCRLIVLSLSLFSSLFLSLFSSLLLALSFVGPSLAADAPKPAEVAPGSLDELVRSAAAGRSVKGTVVVFLGTECPVSNGYLPEMERIFQDAVKREVAMIGVYAEPSVAQADADAHRKEYEFTFPTKLDPEQLVAKQAEVKRMPTAVVVDKGGKIVYRGRIDDRWSPEGRRRDVPRTRELRDAIDAVVAGREPAVREAPPFGCPLPTLRPAK